MESADDAIDMPLAMVARVRRIMRSRVRCRVWMGIFFTWHSSEHIFQLDVKWKARDWISMHREHRKNH
jgi:hypothetical protein